MTEIKYNLHYGRCTGSLNGLHTANYYDCTLCAYTETDVNIVGDAFYAPSIGDYGGIWFCGYVHIPTCISNYAQTAICICSCKTRIKSFDRDLFLGFLYYLRRAKISVENSETRKRFDTCDMTEM